jgi:hypothetical protein
MRTANDGDFYEVFMSYFKKNQHKAKKGSGKT